MEIGIGIHGEPGVKKVPLTSADEITDMLALNIIEDGPYTRTVREWDNDNGEWVDRELTDPPMQAGDQVIAFVNSMGGTPVSELYTVYRRLHDVCQRKGITIARKLIGPYITSLEMQGCSITLLKADDEILRFWDAPVNTPGLRWGV
jgi:dihydroxyacetone kinase-like protein